MICSRIPSNLAFRSAFCKQILAFYHSQNVPNSRLFEMHTFINYAFSSSYKSRSKKHKMIKYAFFIPSDVTSYCLSLLLLRQIPSHCSKSNNISIQNAPHDQILPKK
eukprot:1002385_1